MRMISRTNDIHYVLRAALSKLWPRRFGKQAGVRLCHFEGVKIYLDFSEHMHFNMFRKGEFEPEYTRVLCQVLQTGDIFVDIGANVGWYTLHVLKKRPDVRLCYAYEPLAHTFKLLEDGLRINGVVARCDARQMGISDEAGKTAIKIFPTLDSLHSSLYPLGGLDYEEQMVTLSTLDEEVTTFVAAPHVIKCDVEGNELKVLHGAKKLLKGELGIQPIWFLEVNYERAAVAGYFPWKMIEFAAHYAPYQGYYLRDGQIKPLTDKKALRHGDFLILAIPELHGPRFAHLQQR